MCDIRYRMLTYDIVRDVLCRTYNVVRLYPVYHMYDIARTMYNRMSCVARTTSYVMHVRHRAYIVGGKNPDGAVRRWTLDSAAACTACPCRSASGPQAPSMGPGEAVGNARRLSWEPATAVEAPTPSSSQLTALCTAGLGTPPPPILRAPAAPRRACRRPRWARAKLLARGMMEACV
jgi:hypothetical protein